MDEEGPASTDEPFRTVAGRGSETHVVRGSEFVAYASPAESVEAAEALLEEVRDAHPDATHHVPAYRVRVEGGPLREYESDADEPTGSAGKPVLNVLVRRDLENVAVVVARYFGGTELGVGGLARAYGRAASAAVDAVGVEERLPHRRMRLTADYDDSGTVRGILESEGVEFEADYAETVRFEVTVPRPAADALLDRVASATSGRVEVEPE